MRIISGKARGTKLYTLEGLETRPTLDRVKESIFNIINTKIYDAVALDLFSGSGAIGLEFASRGAKKTYLCDSSKDAEMIIRKNIEKTHLEDEVVLYREDYKKMLEKVKYEKFDLIYLDPPYKTAFIREALILIKRFNCINDDGLIIVETDDLERIINDIKKVDYEIIDQRKYGRANVIFLNKKD